MMGVTEPPLGKIVDGRQVMIPVMAHGVGLMSIGFFLKPSQAVVLRVPMLHRTLEQFLADVLWGELDYLIVDVPPGTGDIPLSISQLVRPTGAVLVTTPQAVALADLIRGRTMLDNVNVKIPVLGLIENMSVFVCDGCGKEHDLFSRGGGRRAAEELGIPFLGEIPIYPEIRASGDAGVPIVVSQPEGAAARAFSRVVDALVGEVAKRGVEAERGRLKLV
jgi:ATP-binding protein involved in chromosome partitioning